MAKKAAKKAAPKKAAPRSAAPTNAPPTKSAKKAAAAPKPAKEATPPKPKPAKRDPSLGPVVKTNVVIPMAFYEANKDAIKAPLKELGLKWNFLGEGKGLYKREREVHCFTQFKDDGVHYAVWGDDKKDVAALLDAWRKLAGEAQWASWTSAGATAVEAEKQEQESEALKLWKLGEPQRRPGEPDFFFDKRVAEWQAKKPA